MRHSGWAAAALIATALAAAACGPGGSGVGGGLRCPDREQQQRHAGFDHADPAAEGHPHQRRRRAAAAGA